MGGGEESLSGVAGRASERGSVEVLGVKESRFRVCHSIAYPLSDPPEGHSVEKERKTERDEKETRRGRTFDDKSQIGLVVFFVGA